MNRLIAIAATALVAILGCIGCVPTPEPNTIDIVGDSISTQAYWGRSAEYDAQGRPANADVLHDEWAGRVFADAQPAATQRAADGRPAIMVIALGTNNAGAYSSGWGPDDEADFNRLLFTPSSSACVVVILPGYIVRGPNTPDLLTQYSMHQAHEAMKAKAAQRPRTIVVDWQAIISANPSIIGPDGIHLASDAKLSGDLANPAAANAWAKMMWDGVARCPA